MSNDERLRHYLRTATTELRDVRRRLRDTRQPVAVIGAGCRFPGGVTSVEDLWRVVSEGRDAIGPFPGDRGWTGQDGPLAGAGGFMPDATGFDAGFFGVSPREARAMDPQQRVLLEVAWEAIERARISADALRGRRVGVFVGVCPSEYGPRQHEGGPDAGYLLTGAAPSVVSGRVAYLLGLTGPAISVDTACSSSLVAIHLACQALRAGQCELALAGGVTVLATPGIFAEFRVQGGLAGDGRCKSFSAAADGTGWAEGAGLVVLERLPDAESHQRRIWAVIRGSAVNSDGASNGLTAPSGVAQRRVIADALADAGLSPADVDAVEAHGTGTRLGDPIEAAALAEAYAPRPADRPLLLGSVKSNIGHTQAAAGVAGLLKMVMAVRHGVVPGSLHATALSPHVDWDTSGLAVVDEAAPWPETGRARRAAISAFGISGTNAHVVLEQATEQPEGEDESAAEPWPAPAAWPLSARSPAALAATGRRLHAHLADEPGWRPERVGVSLATTRVAHAHRAVALGRTRADLLAALAALAEDRDAAGLIRGAGDPTGQLAYVFAGHGSQRPGMGRGLAARHAVFAATLDETCALLDPHLPVPLRRVMFASAGTPDAALLDHTLFTHAAVFAYQISLFRLLEWFGLRPDRLVGHSLGEITAAHAAGVLSLPDACALIAARGALLASLPEGAMAALGTTPEELDGRHPDVTIAAYNSPTDIVVSGPPDAVDDVVAAHRSRGRPAVRLPITRALHSPATHAVLEDFARAARAVTYHPAAIPIISTVTGEPADDALLRDAAHWVAHLHRPVRFAAAVERLGRTRATAILELAPGPTLAGHVRRTLGETHDAHVGAAGRRGDDEPAALLAALAYVHTRTAHAVAWERAHPGGADPVDLPTYPFQRRRYWHPAAIATGRRPHPLAGAPIPLAYDGGGRWCGATLSAGEPWFIAQHALYGRPVLPASAMLEWALAAARSGASGSAARAGDPVGTLRDVTFLAPLPFAEHGAVSVQALVEADGDGRRVRCFARPADRPDESWTEHLTAHAAVTAGARPESVAPDRLVAALTERDVGELYARLTERGLDYGPAFRGVRRLFHREDEAATLVETGADDDSYVLDPVVLDACFHVAAAFPYDGLLLPAGADRVVAYDRLPGRVWCHARWRGQRPSGDHALDLRVLSEAGDVLVTVDGLRLRPVSGAALDRAGGARPRYQEVRWLPDPAPLDMPPRPAGAGDTWLVSADDPALARRWRADLVARGHTAIALGDLDSDDAARAAFARLRRDGVNVAGFVVHAGAAEAGEPVEEAYRLTRRGFVALRHFLDRYGVDRPDVVVCTTGATAPGGGTPDPAQAALGGLARAVIAEYPDLACVHVDLEPGTTPPLLTALLDRVARLPGAGHLARRGDRWYEARLSEHSLPAAAGMPIRGDATYLITGGLGGLGLAQAAWLADRGARCLLLAGRTTPAETPPGVAELRARGARVELRRADVADRSQVDALLAYADRELPPLRGIVHAAGVTADGGLGELDWARFVEVLDPKVRGAWHLHGATAGRDLDFFVLFSSVASLIGAAGQANYVAANAVLDALAGHRRRLGLPATSVSWGPWAGVGMAHRRDLTDRLATAGLRSIEAGAALDALGGALGGTAAHVGIAAVDWRRVRAARRVPYTLLADLVPAEAADGASPVVPRRDRDELSRLVLEDPAQAHEVVLDELLDQLAALLRLPAGDRERLRTAARHTHLNRLGLDSVTTVQLRNRIMLDFSADIPPDVLFGANSAVDVAASICQQLAVRGVVDTGAEAQDGVDTEVLTL
jgi:acyl transferase domain-containing protein